MQVSAVCISRNPESWKIPDVPFCNYIEGWKPFQHEKTKERVDYLAHRRNLAVSRAIELFPDTKHILMIDSYYLNQVEQINQLVGEYSELSHSTYQNGCILGASSWIYDLTRVRGLPLREAERNGGIMKVGSVGGCYLYPRWVWEKTKYDTPEDLHGCEHNWLCEHSGLPVFLSLNQRLWRAPLVYPRVKRVRMSLHLGRWFRRQIEHGHGKTHKDFIRF
jgi:hypothetical protein